MKLFTAGSRRTRVVAAASTALLAAAAGAAVLAAGAAGGSAAKHDAVAAGREAPGPHRPARSRLGAQCDTRARSARPCHRDDDPGAAVGGGPGDEYATTADPG